MKPLLPNSSGSKQSGIILVENGSVIMEPSEVAEVFNDHFSNVVQVDESLKPENFVDHPSIKLIIENESMDNSNFEPVNSSYVREIINNLNPMKAVGVGGLSPHLLRLSAPVLAEEVTKLINYFIANHTWPFEWKSSNITPVFKKQEDTYKGNYRPVSILTSR